MMDADEHCVQLVQEYGLARPLAKLVEEKVEQQFLKSGSRPGEVTQILFGLVSLLRHLAIPGSFLSLGFWRIPLTCRAQFRTSRCWARRGLSTRSPSSSALRSTLSLLSKTPS